MAKINNNKTKTITCFLAATLSTFPAILILLVPNTSVVVASHHPDGFNYKECLPDKEVCEYWLNLQEKLTMVFHKDLVYADKGRLYLYNENPNNYTTVVRNFILLTVILYIMSVGRDLLTVKMPYN